MSSPLLLEPEPQSVRLARVWVVEELEVLGRTDLADAAELGVSELVTNAILHASPPITVRLGGTAQHPRVEVHDNSRRPPTVNSEMAEEDQLMRTVGRGLGIVALYSRSWGADVSSDGKVVWFEPTDEEPGDLAGDVYDLDREVDALLGEVGDATPLIRVRLLGMPAAVFGSFRVWYSEIRRELRLLAFAHGDDYPVATELAEITVQVEHERRQARGIDALDAAIAAGVARVDLDYLVPPTAAATMAHLRDLLDRVDDFCREHRLLTMPASPQQVQLFRWYADEFTRQAEGLEPRPWPGSYDIEPTPA